MLSDDGKAILSEPDAVHFDERVSERLVDFATPFTVPLFFFRGDFAKPWKMGTGTLLNLDGRGYILTAGHVVSQYRQAHACAATIKRTPHTYEARFSRSASRVIEGTSVDVGVLEISQEQFEDYRSFDRLYIEKTSRIHICDASELVAAHDWMAVAGYPFEKAIVEGGGAGMRLVVHTTTIAGLDPAPRSPLPISEPDIGSIDLWVPRKQFQSFPRYESDIDMPLFGGASGGGCWKTDVRTIPRTFDPENPRLRLVAVHIGSTPHIPALANARFGREILVGYHLRLLADEFTDMSRSVFQRWPVLEHDKWKLPSPSTQRHSPRR